MSSCGGGLDGGEDGGSDGSLTWLTNLLMAALQQIGIPTGQTLVAILYRLYKRFTWLSLATAALGNYCFLRVPHCGDFYLKCAELGDSYNEIASSIVYVFKYVSTGLYIHKKIKKVYISSRERTKKIQTKIEDLQLQIEIMDTKLCLRDAEFPECTAQLRRHTKQVGTLRARVRDMFATDEVLRALYHAAEVAPTLETAEKGDPQEEDHEFVLTLLKGLKGSEQSSGLDKLKQLDRGGQSAGDEEPSMYSSPNDDGDKQECRVKIIKVTKVFKVACLKHYIKQKRLRRATQQAILKKKIESITELLESWQKSLNAVIYSKMSMDVASEEAMGDYSKPNLREFSDSDSELKTSCTDVCYDEYNLNWTHNSYYNVQNSELGESKEMFESLDYNHNQEISYPHPHSMLLPAPMCECSAGSGSVLCILPEETSSQVAIEEIDDATTNC